ncbi:MAG: hypothetical protein VB980_07450 [Opitutales bacterium]|jgi:hypothetical protein
MKHLLFIALLLFIHSLSFSQEEDFAEFEDDLREHFNNLVDEMDEELDFMVEDEANLLAELSEAKAEGEERKISSLEIELTRVRVGVTLWKALSAKHQEIMALTGEAFVEQEDPFNHALENAHRKREIAESKANVSHLEAEIRWLRDDEEIDETEEAGLHRELKQAKAQLKNRLSLHEGWQKVETARNEGREEEADQMEHQLWVKSQDLAFQIESVEIRHRAAEARERIEELRRETALAQHEVKMSMELLKHREELRKSWQGTKDALANANEDETEEVLEKYHQAESKFQLKREMLELRFQLSRAVALGDDDEIEVLERIQEELEEESRELDEESRERE